MKTSRWVVPWLAVVLACSTGCGEAATDPSPGTGSSPDSAISSNGVAEEVASEGPQQLDSFDPEFRLDEAWAGDLDGMAERGLVRALVVYSLGQYFLDGATQRGVTYEALSEFEKFLNQRLGRGTIKVPVLIIPVQRDELLPALERGLGDIAAANLTVTRSRMESVDFSAPLVTGVSELVVTGPGGPAPRSIDGSWTFPKPKPAS